MSGSNVKRLRRQYLHPDPGEDQAQLLAFLLPCYTNVPTSFMSNFTQLYGDYCARMGTFAPIKMPRGPYVAQNMRFGVRELLAEYPEWDRLLVVEQDMILPKEAFWKHAFHNEDIVGSLYFQHSPPHHLNAMVWVNEGEHPTAPEAHGYVHFKPEGVALFLNERGLHPVDLVGLGCTSIAREVLEEWPDDSPMFMNEYTADDNNQEFSTGEVSHDVYFCREAKLQKRNIYLDSSIECLHITEGFTTAAHYVRQNVVEPMREEQAAKGLVVLPDNVERQAFSRA